jgi:hypothetical protein
MYRNTITLILIGFVAAILSNCSDPKPTEVRVPDSLKFSDASFYVTGRGPSSICSADFNKDGFSDLATANVNDNNISVLLNDSHGAFPYHLDYSAGRWVNSIACADFNGDSHDDIVVSNSWDNNVSVFLNNGNGTFGDRINFATGASPRNVGLADFDGNGSIDIAIPNSGNATVSILKNNGNGTFQSHKDYPAGVQPSGSGLVGIVCADINGDSHPDIAVTNHISSGNVCILLNNGDGSFRAGIVYTGFNYPHQPYYADIDNDGFIDLVVPNHAGTISILRNYGNGSFGLINSLVDSDGPTWIACANMDDDPFPEIIAGHYTSINQISIFPNHGAGGFGSKINLQVGNNPYSLVIIDIDNDGDMDIAAANREGLYSNNIAILINQTGLK